MKRALISFALFFVVQIFAAITGGIYAYASGFETNSDAFIMAMGIALLIGNLVLIGGYISFFYGKKDAERHDFRHFRLKPILYATLALLLLALGETLGLAPLGLDDPNTERFFTIMLASPLCLLNICVAGPVAEELVFRYGLLGGFLERGTKPWIAVLASAFCFAVIHGNELQTPPAFISGVLLGVIYVRTRSLVPCIIAHVTNNVLALSTMLRPYWENALTAQPTVLLIGEGLLLAAAAFFLTFRIRKYANRNN